MSHDLQLHQTHASRFSSIAATCPCSDTIAETIGVVGSIIGSDLRCHCRALVLAHTFFTRRLCKRYFGVLWANHLESALEECAFLDRGDLPRKWPRSLTEFFAVRGKAKGNAALLSVKSCYWPNVPISTNASSRFPLQGWDAT